MAGLFACQLSLYAQEAPLENPTRDDAADQGDEIEVDTGQASIFNESDARTITLSIPAPRGLILDREGRPFAQTKMAYHLALDFTAFDGKDPAEAVAWAHQKVAEANALVAGDQSYSDKTLSRYYKSRRWIPRKISQILTEEKAREIGDSLPAGLTLLPVYQRFYPQKSLAAHLIGYVGAKTVMPSGPINDGDPIFQSVMGKSGFERVFDDKLTGVAGQKKLVFDKQGEKVIDEITRRPQPGGNVVTTIDLDWQQYAERVLREGSKRGAMVIIDIQSGEVLVMASRPTYDLNEFVPYITQDRFKELSEDQAKPLYGRAFQAGYPPASTFKPVVTLASITSGAVRYNERIDCPYKIKIGNIWFRNHTKGNMGPISAQRALASSTNPWFYKAGIRTGPQTFLSFARRMGYGSKTGLPLVGENAGIAPSQEYIERSMGRSTTDGDAANLAIGQGLTLATPLQVAQSMAAIGNGEALMELQLVRQIQDFHGRVIESPTFKKKNDLNFDQRALRVTKEGMRDVVHASYGTGKRADLGFTIMCGKTGTAQWKPDINQNLAWFSGFFPMKSPRYAFAVVYEGVPNENVSGGKKAAPMVKRFFWNFRSEIQENLKAAPKAIIVEQEPEEEETFTIPKALVIEDDEFEPAEPDLPPVAIPANPDPAPALPAN